jgi:hypothetical protein
LEPAAKSGLPSGRVPICRRRSTWLPPLAGLQFAFLDLKFATASATNCKLVTANLKLQIRTTFALGATSAAAMPVA